MIHSKKRVAVHMNLAEKQHVRRVAPTSKQTKASRQRGVNLENRQTDRRLSYSKPQIH